MALWWAGGTLAAGTMAASSWLLYPSYFPASSAPQLAAAEAALLDGLRGKVSLESRFVSDGKHRINTVVVRRLGAAVAEPVGGLRSRVATAGSGGGDGQLGAGKDGRVLVAVCETVNLLIYTLSPSLL